MAHSSYKICFGKLCCELLKHPSSHASGLRDVCVALLILRDFKIGSSLRLIHSQASGWCNGTKFYSYPQAPIPFAISKCTSVVLTFVICRAVCGCIYFAMLCFHSCARWSNSSPVLRLKFMPPLGFVICARASGCAL